jgi:hypothetical protein
VNTGAPWPDLDEAEFRVLTKGTSSPFTHAAPELRTAGTSCENLAP